MLRATPSADDREGPVVSDSKSQPLPTVRPLTKEERLRKLQVAEMFRRQILSAQDSYDRIMRELASGYVDATPSKTGL